jgi:sulfite exporter TauE/SafE/copper chaperone CopZ
MERKKKIIPIRGMHCTSCELLIEDELKGIAGVERVEVSHAKGEATVFYGGAVPDEAAVVGAVRKAGYEVGRDMPSSWISRDLSVYLDIAAALVLFSLLYLFAKANGWFALSLGTGAGFGSLSFVLLVGLVAGVSTCMAMVGGIVLGVSARFAEKHPEASARTKFRPQLFFQAGRVAAFFLFGGLLGTFGSFLQLSSFMTGVFSVLIAVVMLLLGLQLTGLFPRLERVRITLPKVFGKPFMGKRSEYSHRRAMLLGVGTFFLPCGFTQAVQLYAIGSGSFLSGALAMGVFAVGTMPGLLGIGGIAALAEGSFSRYFFRYAGVLVVLLAFFNMTNGLNLISVGSTGGNDAVPAGTTVKTSSDSETKSVSAEPQVIRMVQDADGYSPATLTVKKRQPVSWIIESKDSYSCATSLTVPKLNIRKALAPGENVITFTPNEAGDIPFSCSMGMYRGVIHVVE